MRATPYNTPPRTPATSLLGLAVMLLSLMTLFAPWDTLEPAAWAATYTVTTTNDSGAGSLRQAILDANTTPGMDTIAFNIGGGGPQTIAPLSALPNISDPVTIDGATQPGASAGTPIIELSGVNGLGGTFGLQIFAPDCVVRGLVINRFRGALQLGGSRAVVEGNYFGTDITGTVAVGNTQSGLDINTSDNTIGGTTPQARNVISGSGEAGIILHGSFSAVRNLIQGNYIGTDATGTVALGNDEIGVAIGCASDNTIGGTTPGTRNVISGNGGYGVLIDDCHSTSRNKVWGNYIGLDATGTVAVGNQVVGVSAGKGSMIGRSTPGAGNVIAFNSGSGVVLFSGTGSAILGNAIFSNGGLGIDLGSDGVTPNDTGDSDTGANNLQNFPLLTSAISSGGSTIIEGTLNSAPNTSFLIEFFTNAACNPSGYGEGQAFLTAIAVTTDSSGDASFSIPASAPTGQLITATATDPDDNTSEFSQCVEVTTPVVDADLAIVKADSPDPITVGQTLTYTLTATNDGPLEATGVVVTDTLPSEVTFVSASGSQGSCNGTTTVSCTLGNLTNGSSATVTIRVTPTTAGSLSNTASIQGNQPDPNPANNTDTETTTVRPAADLAMTMTDSPDPVKVKTTLTYTLMVRNHGPSPATGGRSMTRFRAASRLPQ
jgi:uncharacterized repeat protein (TIGR01451 family)